MNHVAHAHTLVPLTPAVMDQNGDEPERSGGAKHGDDDNSKGAPQRFIQVVPEHLWTTRELPEGRGGAEEVGAVPATLHRDGAKEDDAEKTA